MAGVAESMCTIVVHDARECAIDHEDRLKYDRKRM